MTERPVRGTPWTREQDDELRQLVAARRSLLAIAAATGRTIDAVRGRAQTLRLPLTTSRRPWRQTAIPPPARQVASEAEGDE